MSLIQILDCILYKSAASLVQKADLHHDPFICKNPVGCRSPLDARRRKGRCPWLRIQVYLESSCDSNEQTSTMAVTAIIAAKDLHDSYLWHSLERMTEI